MATKISSLHKELAFAILEHLSNIKSKRTQPRLLISGECDSNQSLFERRSNECSIGILAYSDDVGYSLLYLLRMILDDNFVLLDCVCVDEVGIETSEYKGNMTDIIQIIKDKETLYTDKYTPSQRVKRELIGYENRELKTTQINKAWDEVDIWTFARIKNAIGDLPIAE